MKILFIAAALLVACVFCDRVTLYNRKQVPEGSFWRRLKPAADDFEVTFTITLQRQNIKQLEEKWYAVSDPESPEFAQHLTRAEITELIAAPVHDQKKVLAWIHSVADTLPAGNLIHADNQKDAIVVKSTVAFAEALFETNMYYYAHSRTRAVVAKHYGSLSVPKKIQPFITMISGITELLPPNRLNSRANELIQDSQVPATDNLCNVPITMKQLYDWDDTLVVNNKSSNASIYAEDSVGNSEGFGIGSVADWEKANGLPPNPISCILGNGKTWYVSNDTDDEAQLDTQMITGMAQGANTCFYVMDQGNGWMYELARYVFATPNAPLVLSMSYAWWENDECLNASYSFLGNCTAYHIPNSQQYVNQTNIEFMKLGVAGHTLLASSGDDGTAGGHSTEDNCATMGPLFPAASPYVTTVGATSLEPTGQPLAQTVLPPICRNFTAFQCNCSTSTNEQAATNNNSAGFDSGGGFSVYTPMPTYQVAAVQGYIKSGVTLPPQKYWNAKNRAYPDIAALGENICVLDPNTPCNLAAGTSCSAPITAAMVTVLNNDRLNAGKRPLGPFNQVIYKMYSLDKSKYFNNMFDEANNSGECDAELGFNTKPGFWSPVTGCGSPKVAAIRAYVATLP